MGKIEGTLRSEIMRLAKREVRATFLPLKREVWEMKLKLSNLSKSFIPLERMAKEQVRQAESQKPRLEATSEEVKASRLTAERIRNLRKKLGISQRELAILTGSSIGAVLSWEKGKFKPSVGKKASLVALRKLRKRDVKKLLSEKSEQLGKKNPEKSKTKDTRRKSPIKGMK